MANTVSYNYSPGQLVYVINTLGPKGQYPYWGFPFVNCGYPAFPFETGFCGPGAYPNGFTSTTPAIQSGTVLQTRILFTSSAPTTPTIMYDIRIDSEFGTVPFPESMVYPATPGTAGQQTVSYSPALTQLTPVSMPTNTYRNTIYVNGQPFVITLDLSTTPTVGNVVTAINAQLGVAATVTFASGNLQITSALVGATSSIYVATNAPNPDIFSNLPGYQGFLAPSVGTASGLDQATAAYEVLVK